MQKKINLPSEPLAERVRPKKIEEFVGQNSLLGEGKPIRTMIDRDTLSSFILWGPPGSGKTTIARIISEQTNSDFHQLNAVSSGVKDIRDIINLAKNNLNLNRKTILFIDEIHRFNKAQQDALLAAVESGLIILLGATTENPSFEVIPALRSRARVFTLEELSKADLELILKRAIENDRFLSSLLFEKIDSDALIYLSGGDARIMLNILEAAVIHELESEKIVITENLLEEVVQRKNIVYDKAGEEHYNVISAFIKSIRGSDPDAAIYYLARMLEGGEDPLFIARRMIILASEDVGNASPNALLLAQSAFEAVNKIGMPESRIILSQCAIYLACAPKSNAAYLAIDNALRDVRQKKLYPTPMHLRNAPTKLMKEIGYGSKYKYPHDFPGSFIEETYLPEELKNVQYYFPSDNGQEKSIKERLKAMWRKLKKY